MCSMMVWDSEPMKLFSSDVESSDEDEDDLYGYGEDKEEEEEVDVDDWEVVDRKLVKISGGKGLELIEIINELEKLAIHATTPAQLLQILLSLLYHRFSLKTAPPGTMLDDGHVSAQSWNSILYILSLLFNLLQQYPNINVNTNQLYNRKETKKPSHYYGNIYIHDDLCAYLQKLERNLCMRLQCVNFFTPSQFLEIFAYEARLCLVVENFFYYFHHRQDFHYASVASLIIIKIVHYKTNYIYNLFRKSLFIPFPEPEIAISQSLVVPSPLPSITIPNIAADFMDHLTSYIYEFAHDWVKVHATLYHVYHSALIGNYSKGVEIVQKRGLLNLYNMSVSTQLLFNRAVAQLGLSAFRAGFPEQAHHLLCMFGDGVAEELLAQGHRDSGRSCKTIQQQFQERRYSFPYHMRINLDHLQHVIETCWLYIEGNHKLPKATVRAEYTGIPKMVEDHLLIIRNQGFQTSNMDSPEFWIR